MLRYLELTSTLIAQQAILLEKLPGWNILQLEEVLSALKEKRIVSILINGPTERKISLDDGIETTLNNEEKKLRSLLYGYSSHQ